MKPVKQSELLDAIARRARRARPRVERSRRRRSAPRRACRAALRILLAEDNAVNQKLVAAASSKSAAIARQVADNGREALDAARRASVSISILMDVQMPEMDGFEATRRIRAAEQATGAALPIIAMTAHAMTGDRERCLAAGMDDYLSKPLDKAEVLAMLDHVHLRNGS